MEAESPMSTQPTKEGRKKAVDKLKFYDRDLIDLERKKVSINVLLQVHKEKVI
jgi:hypothetical protein